MQTIYMKIHKVYAQVSKKKKPVRLRIVIICSRIRFINNYSLHS